jgi:hypothetical protein
MNDLFGDLPAAAGDDGTTGTSGKTAKNAAILLRRQLMPPPKRPVAARPPSSMAPPHARPRAVVAQAPIEVRLVVYERKRVTCFHHPSVVR